MRVPFGSLPDTILETILGAFGVPLGSLGASLWEKMGFGKASKKWSEKQECEKSRDSLRRTRFVPINHHSSSLLGPFWEPCGTSLDHFDHFESMFLCDSLIAHHFVLRTSGTVADYYHLYYYWVWGMDIRSLQIA